MAALTISALRQRIATQLTALSGWTQSPFDHERLVTAGTPAQHLQYALEVSVSERSTSPHSSDAGALVDTTVIVHWLYRRNQKDHATTLDSALDAEQNMILKVLATSKTSLAIAWVRSDRVLEGDWFVGETEFIATHAIAFLAA